MHAKRLYLICGFVLGALVAISVDVESLRAEEPKGAQRDSHAGKLVREALRAELAGDNNRRAERLASALRTAPASQPANWQSGRLKTADGWQSLAATFEMAKADRRLARYHQLRAQTANSVAGNRQLARWCRRSKLDERARVHWVFVLERKPSDVEAMNALRLRNHHGVLLTVEQIQAVKQQAKANDELIAKWTPRVADWKKAAKDPSSPAWPAAVAQMRAITDPQMIYLLESLVSSTDERLAVEIVEVIDRMKGPKAVDSLVRHAVLCPFPAVREAATAALKDKSHQDFVPTLLLNLVAPIEVDYHSQTLGTDGFYRLELFRSGAHADYVHARTLAWHIHDVTHYVRRGYSVRSDGIARAMIGLTVQRRFQALARAALVANLRADALNRRLFAVLKATTGKALPDHPRPWWDWWNELYERHQERQVYQTSTDEYRFHHQERKNYSCFVRGTPVWTEFGARNIEQVRVGDRVLAQDVESGELAFKLVLQTTVRPPSETLRVRIGREEVWTTRGHAFWANGQGWRMAKQLKPGDMLHGVDGSTRIEAIEPGPETEAYNLVVADFNNYFVSGRKLLVHDNAMFRSTQMLLPGLPRTEPDN